MASTQRNLVRSFPIAHREPVLNYVAPPARILRFLATNHWFTEVAPDVFANNLLSSLLDTGKEITSNLYVVPFVHWFQLTAEC